MPYHLKKFIPLPTNPIAKFVLLLLFCILVFFYVLFSENHETRFQRLDEQGNNHYARHEYRKALNAWKKASAIHGNSADIHRKTGKAFIKLSYFSLAKESFDQAVRIKEDAWDVWIDIVKLELISKNIEAAEACWEKLSQALPDDPAIHILHGDLLVLKNRLDEAEFAYRQALAVAPQSKLAIIRLATCYLAQNKTDLSKKTYNILALMEIKSLDVLLQMANFWKFKGNLQKAEEYFLKSVELEPENLGLQQTLARFYYETRKLDKARKILSTILVRFPENRPIKKFFVEIMLAQGQFQAVEPVLAELSQENKDDFELDLLNGKYHLLVLKPLIAANYFKLALQKNSDHVTANYLLGIAYLVAGFPELARQKLIKVLTLAPLFSDAELTLADIYYKKKEYDLSYEHAIRITAREPANFRAHLIAGNSLLVTGKYEDAYIKFRLANKINSDAISPLYYMAYAAEKAKKSEHAIELYKKLLARSPNLADVTERYIDLLINNGEIKTAELFLQEKIKHTPESGYLHYLSGKVYLALGNLIQAEACLSHAISIAPGLVASYLKLAKIYEKNQNLEKQMQLLEDCINKAVHSPEIYNILANLYMQAGLLEKATSLLESTMSKDLKSPLLASNLAWLYLEQNIKMERAFELAQFAYREIQDDPGVLDTIGWAYYKKGLYNQAIWYLTEALSLDQDHSLLHFHLGMAFYGNGSTDEAIKSLKKSLSLQLKNPQKKKAEKLLEHLQQNTKKQTAT